MFDDVLRELKKFDHGMKVSVDLELDDNGYLDRRCPTKECGTLFKVMFEDWKNLVRDEEVFCPQCRHDAESSKWNTPEQDEYIKEYALVYVQRELGRALQSGSRKFNSRQSGKGLIQLKMSYKPRHIPVPMPTSATEVMTQEYVCERCRCRYSSIGAAFFCPACGYNSAFETFANSVSTVRNTLASIPEIRAALLAIKDKNAARDTIRHICENGLVKLVSSFERYSEACFLRHPNSHQFPTKRNLFQRLREAGEHWRNTTSTGYTDILTAEEFKLLDLYFQQRHILAHRDGIVDQRYIDKTDDDRFDVGQRLVITESQVHELAGVISKLGDGLSKLVANEQEQLRPPSSEG